jgi:hypothetical protein
MAKPIIPVLAQSGTARPASGTLMGFAGAQPSYKLLVRTPPAIVSRVRSALEAPAWK